MASAGDLAQAVADKLATRVAAGPTAKEQRELARRITAIQADGICAATRIEMGGFVTAVAMHHVAMASEREVRLIQRSPLGAARYQLLVDSLTALAANEIDDLSTGWRR